MIKARSQTSEQQQQQQLLTSVLGLLLSLGAEWKIQSKKTGTERGKYHLKVEWKCL